MATCPKCGEEIKKTDAKFLANEKWFHKRCGGVYVVSQAGWNRCPLCDSEDDFKVKGFRGNQIVCNSCSAEWEIEHSYATGAGERIKLRESGTSRNGGHLLGIWQPLNWRIKTDLKKVTKETLPESMGQPWQNVLVLEENENVVQSWKGDYEARMTAMDDTFLGKTPTTVKQTKSGILVLTNQKLVWIEERGIFGKSYHPQITIPLENIKGISMGGAVLKYVSILDHQSEYVFHLLNPKVIELGPFKKIVYDQVNVRKQELEAEKKKERVHIMLDFSFLKSYMEKGGLAVQTVKCPECRASIKLPESGDQTTCEHCGSTVYAQDVFEKVKALIG